MGQGVGLSVWGCLAPLAPLGWLPGVGRLVPCDAHVGGSESHPCLAGHLSRLRAKDLAEAGHGCAWSPDVVSPVWGH